MTRIRTLALAAALSALTLGGAQAGWMTGTGGINGTSLNGLASENGWQNGLNANGLDSNNGLDSENGIPTYNGIPTLNGLGQSNGMGLNGVSGSNGIDAAANAGHAILEIHLADGTVARTGR